MATESKIIVGLDIGTTKICAIVGRENENKKIEILGIGKSNSSGVRRGVVSNIQATVDCIKEAVKQAELNADVEISVVSAGIAGQHIRSMQHRGLLTRKNADDMISYDDVNSLIDDMHRLVLPPGEKIIHVIPQEYIVDSETGVKYPIGMSGHRLEANCHIITGQETHIGNILRCITMAGLRVDELILEPLASSEAVLTKEEKEAGVALVDIGGGTTDVAIFYDGIIRHTAVIALGGDIITQDIREGCAVIERQAEQLKVKFGSAFPQEADKNVIINIPSISAGKQPKTISAVSLAQIIEARVDEIINVVKSEIITSGYEKKLIAGIVLTGGGSMLSHLVQLTEYLTGCDARVGVPSAHISTKDSLNLNSPIYSTGVGLLIKGIQKSKEEKQYVSTDSNKPTESEDSTIQQKQEQKRKKSLFGSIKSWVTADEKDTPLD